MRIFAQELATLWRNRSLAWLLARRDMDGRHAAAAGGVVWAYIQPLLMVAAYYLLFDVVFSMRVGEEGKSRALGQFLIVGALPWMAFCDAVARAMNSLLDAGSLLQKNALPAVLFPVRAVMASTFVFGPLIVLVALGYFPIHRFGWPVLSLFPLLALQLTLCCVLGYLLAVLAAALRDTVQFVTFFLTVGIFISPVLFPVGMFPEDWRWVLWMNPMTPIVSGYQSVLLHAAWPSAGSWWGPLAWIAGSAWLLDVVLTRSRDELVDWL